MNRSVFPVLVALALGAAQAAPPAHRALLDPRLSVRVVASRKLLYADGADAREDRPVHVRAASGLAWLGGRLAIVQDDAAFVALWDPATRRTTSIPLPAIDGHRQFDALRGNKSLKLDLEAAAGAGDELVLLGSGSKACRAVAVRIRGVDRPSVRVVPLARTFDRLRACTELAGSELNLEGAVRLRDGRLRVFQRGNGAPGRGLAPVDATADLAGPLEDARIDTVRRYDLGAVRGVRLTFTDATPGPDGTVLYLASAEDSPDAVADGPVAGCAIGVIAPGGGARQCLLADGTGRPLPWKLEGLALDPQEPGRAYAVADPDDPARPAVLLTLALSGPWFPASGSPP